MRVPTHVTRIAIFSICVYLLMWHALLYLVYVGTYSCELITCYIKISFPDWRNSKALAYLHIINRYNIHDLLIYIISNKFSWTISKAKQDKQTAVRVWSQYVTESLHPQTPLPTYTYHNTYIKTRAETVPITAHPLTNIQFTWCNQEETKSPLLNKNPEERFVSRTTLCTKVMQLFWTIPSRLYFSQKQLPENIARALCYN